MKLNKLTEIRIKLVENEEELEIFKDMTTYAFAPSPRPSVRSTDNDKYEKEHLNYLLYEDDDPVSSLTAIPMTENVRGKIFEMSGIAGVSTYPKVRRKGYVKKLMQKAFEDAYERKQAFTTLYPFRQSFYGRFGYVTFPQTREVLLVPSHLRDIRDLEIEGKVERFLLGSTEVTQRFNSYLKKQQISTHGMGLFKDLLASRLENSKRWVAFANINGEDEGVIIYTMEGFEKPMSVMVFHHISAEAKYKILQWFSVHIDQVNEIKLRLSTYDKVENWGYDFKAKVKSRDWVPSAMGRVLIVSEIGGMKVGAGEIGIKVNDPHCPWNNNIWKFSSMDGKLKVEPAKEFDVEMSIQGLSALVYGGFELDDLRVRGWITMDGAQKEILNSMFPPALPEIYEMF